MDLSIDPLVPFGSEYFALPIPLFLLSPRIITLCCSSSAMTKDHFFVIFYGTKWLVC